MLVRPKLLEPESSLPGKAKGWLRVMRATLAGQILFCNSPFP
jgi:hypothetical protein